MGYVGFKRDSKPFPKAFSARFAANRGAIHRKICGKYSTFSPQTQVLFWENVIFEAYFYGKM